jgi:hypothetical protein
LIGYRDADMAGDIDTTKRTPGSSSFSATVSHAKVVALSSCEAEYIAVTWSRVEAAAPEIMVDNMSAIDLAKKSVFHDRPKHIDVH